MHRRIPLYLVVLGSALFLGSLQLAGQETPTVDVGGTRVALPVPEGHCDWILPVTRMGRWSP